MMDSLYTAATGMAAMQMNVDTIANNLANVNTNAFKAGRMSFQDLLYQQVGDRNAARHGAQVGMGVAPAGTQTNFTQGDLHDSDSPLDVAISGEGFLQVTMPDGSIGYTRDGQLKIDANGQLVTSGGYQLEPITAIPMETDMSTFKISSEGLITGNVNGEFTVLGQLDLARFANPQGLAALGSNVYGATVNSGEAQVSAPGSGGAGVLMQGKTEGSNVTVMTEMVDMINAQRAFESVSKVISTSDEMLSIANQMRR